MAFNNNNNNQYNNDDGRFKNLTRVFSPLKFVNGESTIDPSCMNIEFSNNLLQIGISQRIDNPNQQGKYSFDRKNAIVARLTHIKARILYEAICKLQEDTTGSIESVTVNTADMIVTVANGKQFSVDDNIYSLVIRQLDQDTAKVLASCAYEFRRNHYSILNFDESTGDYDKYYHESIELEQFKCLLKTYYESMTGALAYSNAYHSKYDIYTLLKNVASIQENLGIIDGNRYISNNNGNYFDKPNNSNDNIESNETRNKSRASSLDELENSLLN